MSINKKCLWISPLKDMSGYAKASRNYLRCLANESNLVARSVRYDSGNKQPLSSELKVLHDRDCKDAEVIIQMLTPNEMRPVQGKKNIAVCCWETDRIPQYWVDALNKFDCIIVPCEANKVAYIQSGVTKPIHIVPFTFFKDEYEKTFEKFLIPGVSQETIIYYNISQWSSKKGIDDIIKAYYLAFQNDEDVILVLKGYIGMQNQQGDAQKLLEQINLIRNAMKLPKFPKIYVTDQMMTEDEVLRLHKSCNIYVNLSRGEGWGVPAFESLLVGNELISVEHTGMHEYLNEICPINPKYYGVESRKSPVYGMNHPDPKLYTAQENWYEANILSAVDAFKKSSNTLEKRNKNIDWFASVNPDVIAGKLVDIINA